MTSSRVSSLGYIERRLMNWDIRDSTRVEHYLEEIRMLKQRVVDMRGERIRRCGEDYADEEGAGGGYLFGVLTSKISG
jgi:hypothetical protein